MKEINNDILPWAKRLRNVENGEKRTVVIDLPKLLRVVPPSRECLTLFAPAVPSHLPLKNRSGNLVEESEAANVISGRHIVD